MTKCESSNGPGTMPFPKTLLTEESLVALAKRGDSEAYSELYRRHSEKILRRILRMTGNREDAEDVLQEAMMKGLVHLRGFEGRSAFSTWLTRIAINGALMMRRKRGSRFDRSIESLGEPGLHGEIQLADRTPAADVQMHLHETHRQIHRAIQRLPRTLRGPLVLQVSEDLSVNELAIRLGISVPAAKSRLMRARMLVTCSVKKSQGSTQTWQETAAPRQ